MTREQLIAALSDYDRSSENERLKEVIVIVEGQPMPYPDITGLGEANEDTVILLAKVFQ